jgi:hypothetical protein
MRMGEFLDLLRERRECQKDFHGPGPESLGVVSLTGCGALARVWARGRLCSREYLGKGASDAGVNCCNVADLW